MLPRAALALAATLASAAVVQRTDIEVAVYGHEGTTEENVRPRPVAGWPAPFVADSSHTSVLFQLGIEDDFRPGSFLASFAFWFLISSLLGRLLGALWPRKEKGRSD